MSAVFQYFQIVSFMYR